MPQSMPVGALVTVPLPVPALAAFSRNLPSPDWTTLRVCPPIVRVPVLESVVVLAVYEYFTVPLPVPLAPEVMVSHEVLLAAVHVPLHPDGVAVTVTVPVPAEELTD